MAPPNWFLTNTGFTDFPVMSVDRRSEGANGVEVCVAVVFPEFAVEMIGAAVDAHVEDGAGGAPILGAVVVRLDAELADGVGRGLNGLVGEALVRCAVSVVVQTVEQEVVLLAAIAVYVVGSVAAGHRLVFQHVGAHTGSQQRQIGVSAAVQRKIAHIARGDNLTAFAVFGIQAARLRRLQ